MKRPTKTKQPNWRGHTVAARVKTLESEVNALNAKALEPNPYLAALLRLEERVEQLENHPPGCSCTRCTG